MELPLPDGPNKDMWLALVDHDNVRLEHALQAGADPNFTDARGLAPLMLAVFCDNAGAISLLAGFGAVFPGQASGAAFDSYFDVSPPWYDMHHDYTAAEVVAARGDLHTLKMLLALPGAGGVLASSGAGIAALARGHDGEPADRRAVRLMLGALVLHEWRGDALTAGEEDLARQAVFGFLTNLVFEKADLFYCSNVQVQCADEHVHDRGFGPAGELAGVRALSFSIDYVASPDIVLKAVGVDVSSWAGVSIDVKEGLDNYKFGSLEISPNIAVRMSRVEIVRSSANDDRSCDCSYGFQGTILFSESVVRLAAFVAALGPEASAGELLSEVAAYSEGDVDLIGGGHSLSYQRVAYAVRAGADTSLSHFGSLAADVRAAANYKLGGLQALLEYDPVSARRLVKPHFDIKSPLAAALENAKWVREHDKHPSGVSPKQFISKLIEIGAAPDASVGYGPSVICLASACLDEALLEVLIESGANVSVLSANGNTPLVASCQERRVKNARRLLAAGAEPNQCTAKGVSPLEIACIQKNEALIDLLLKAGADVRQVLRRRSEGAISFDESLEARLRALLAKSAMSDVMAKARAGLRSAPG